MAQSGGEKKGHGHGSRDDFGRSIWMHMEMSILRTVFSENNKCIYIYISISVCVCVSKSATSYKNVQGSAAQPY